jgi:hypothetical protein
MSRSRAAGVGIVAFLVAVLALTPGIACFDPHEPACAFSCANDGKCPTDYVCASDNLCHRADGKGFCAQSPIDASADTAED